MTNDASDRYRRDGWWRDATFLDDLRRHVAERPAKTALLAHRIADDAFRTLDYAELVRQTDLIEHGLLDLGVKPGEFVGAQLPNGPEILALALACIRVGARLAPLMQIYRRRELEFMLGLTETRVFITVAELAGNRPAETVQELSDKLPALEHIVVIGDEVPAGTISFTERFLSRQGETGAPLAGNGLELGPDDPFLVLFTSGTTGGSPKGAIHSQNTLFAGIHAYTEALGLDDGLVKTTPHTHMHYVGLVQGLLAPMVLGATAVCVDAWDPAGQLDVIERHGITMFYASPPFVHELLEAQRIKPRNTGALTDIVSGSSPVPPQMVDEVIKAFGVRMHSLWGMTENGPVTLTRSDDPQDWAAHSDGSPTGGMEVRIQPLEGRADGAGALWVRGPAQCLGYYKGDEAYAADLDSDGWFNTGDLARDDTRGGIRIAGRTKDIIMFKGFNVPVADIETLLGRHPQVREIALIGIADPAVGERVCAVMTASDDTPTLADLRAYLDDAGVNDWFWPERLELIDAMPRTITGKIRKIDLRERYDAT
jgi:cyclohexanecarboxylate-CoA ligase